MIGVKEVYKHVGLLSVGIQTQWGDEGGRQGRIGVNSDWFL